MDIEDIKKITYKEGDILLVKIDNVPLQQREKFAKYMEKHLPGIKVIVIPKNTETTIIGKEENFLDINWNIEGK